MNKTRENLLLHPVRMRIFLAVAGRQVTAQQLAAELPDIPQATLYRNINTLAAAGMLVVVGEKRVRNTIEKTYALPAQGVMLTPEDWKNAQPEDAIQLAARFFGLLMGRYLQYIQKGNFDLAQDNVLFQMVPLYVSREEALELGRALGDLLIPYTRKEPSPERKHLILSLVSFPDVTGGPMAPGSSESAAEDTSDESSNGEE